MCNFDHWEQSIPVPLGIRASVCDTPAEKKEKDVEEVKPQQKQTKERPLDLPS